MKVQLSYGAFTQTMSIYIDDQPLSHVSRLTKYQSQPFETWCEEITPHRPNTIFHQRLLPNTASIYCGYVHFIPFLKLNSMRPSCWIITLSTSATNVPGSKPKHSRCSSSMWRNISMRCRRSVLFLFCSAMARIFSLSLACSASSAS